MNKYLGKSCKTLQRDILWSPLVPGPTLRSVVSPRSPTTADRMLRAVYQFISVPIANQIRLEEILVTMDKQQKKKRKRGPYLKNTSEAEDESELTLSVDSSFANLQEETDEVLKEQTTSSSSSNRLRVTVSINWTYVSFLICIIIINSLTVTLA